MLETVREVVARQLGKTVEEVPADRTFAALGADDLDLVEITMEVEDLFGIAIPDASLVAAAGISDAERLCDHLTVRAFSKAAESAPKQGESTESPETAADDHLREAQVGSFRDLSKLPNPMGLVLVFIPSLDVITQRSQQQLGRKLTDEELEAVESKAIVIALPAEVADEMLRKQVERTVPARPDD